MRKHKVRLSGIYLGLVLLFIYLPIGFVAVYSFNESSSTAVWKGFSLKWYQALFQDASMAEALKNSLLLGVISCLAAAVIGTMGAMGLIKANARAKGVMEYIATLPIMIPEIILGMVFMAFFAVLRLPFGMATLALAHTAFCVPYILTMVKARLAGMDPALEEAAMDLGASPARTFFDITLPLVTPAVLSGSLLAFAMSLDDVVISIFVNGPKINTLPVKVYTQMKFGVTPEINALCTIMLAITLLALAGYSLIRRVRVFDKKKEV
ncbi:MAG: ABC transporter permease [Lachnospiraceae bacterium]|nr:ABC transporter permease [Lachnospiraceae bacterium]MCI9547073.1 ABC transporter permease [Lachnospiraceae bacterium]